MSIEVKFFASLSDILGKKSASLDAASGLTVAEIWNLSTDQADFPLNTLCAINMDYAQPTDAVSDGDEVAFFPPVTGG